MLFFIVGAVVNAIGVPLVDFIIVVIESVLAVVDVVVVVV